MRFPTLHLPRPSRELQAQPEQGYGAKKETRRLRDLAPFFHRIVSRVVGHSRIVGLGILII